jgi:hypothetical protein
MAHRTLAFRCVLTPQMSWASAKWPTAFPSHLSLAQQGAAARDGRR